MLFLTCEQIEETEGSERYSVVNRTILDAQEKKVVFQLTRAKTYLIFQFFRERTPSVNYHI